MIVVYVPLAIQKERLKNRDKLSDQEIENRLKAQMPLEEKIKKTRTVIDNSGSVEETKKKLQKILNTLK